MRIKWLVIAVLLVSTTAFCGVKGGGVKGGGAKGGYSDNSGADYSSVKSRYDLQSKRFNPTVRIGRVRPYRNGNYYLYRSSGTDNNRVHYSLIYLLDARSFKYWVKDISAHNSSGRKLKTTVQVYRQQGGPRQVDGEWAARYTYYCRVVHVQVPAKQGDRRRVNKTMTLRIAPSATTQRGGKVYYQPGRGRRSSRYYTYVFTKDNFDRFFAAHGADSSLVRIRITAEQQQTHSEMAGSITTVIRYARILSHK